MYEQLTPAQRTSKLTMILTWTCQFCGWANDNNNGPCRKCGGQTEMRLVRGHWKEVTIKEPKRADAAGDAQGEKK